MLTKENNINLSFQSHFSQPPYYWNGFISFSWTSWIFILSKLVELLVKDEISWHIPRRVTFQAVILKLFGERFWERRVQQLLFHFKSIHQCAFQFREAAPKNAYLLIFLRFLFEVFDGPLDDKKSKLNVSKTFLQMESIFSKDILIRLFTAFQKGKCRILFFTAFGCQRSITQVEPSN